MHHAWPGVVRIQCLPIASSFLLGEQVVFSGANNRLLPAHCSLALRAPAQYQDQILMGGEHRQAAFLQMHVYFIMRHFIVASEGI